MTIPRFGVNRQSRLAANLASFSVVRGGVMLDIFNHRIFSASIPASPPDSGPTVGQLGEGWWFYDLFAVSDHLSLLYNEKETLRTDEPFTIASWITYRGLPYNGWGMIGGHNGNVSNAWGFYTTGGEGRDYSFGFTYAGGAAWNECHGGQGILSVGSTYLLSCSIIPGTLGSTKLYLNGKPLTVTYYSGTDDNVVNDYSYQNPQFWIGSDYWTQSIKADIFSLGIWKRVLSPGEHLLLYDPMTRWDLIQPVIPKMYWQLGIPQTQQIIKTISDSGYGSDTVSQVLASLTVSDTAAGVEELLIQAAAVVQDLGYSLDEVTVFEAIGMLVNRARRPISLPVSVAQLNI